MPLPYQLDIGSLPSVATGVKSQIQVPKYGRIFGFMLQFNNSGTPLTDAQIANDVVLIRLVADGQEIHSVSARDLMIYLNRNFGAYANGNIFQTGAPVNGTVFLPLANMAYQDYVSQTATSLGTANIQNLFLEITFSSGAITANACAISMFHDLVAAPWTQYFSITTFPQTLVTGVNEIQQLPKESDVNVLQYMIVNSNAAGVKLTRSEIIVNSTPVLQLPLAVAQVKECLMNKLIQIPCTGSAAIFTALDASFLDFNVSNDLYTFLGLNGVTDQRLKLTMTGTPGNVNIVRFANRNRAAK